jgi:hypothetical protein
LFRVFRWLDIDDLPDLGGMISTACGQFLHVR